eukprot:4904-Prymnesium_polylepis.1
MGGRELHKTQSLDLAYVGQMPDVRTARDWQPELPITHAQVGAAHAGSRGVTCDGDVRPHGAQ